MAENGRTLHILWRTKPGRTLSELHSDWGYFRSLSTNGSHSWRTPCVEIRTIVIPRVACVSDHLTKIPPDTVYSLDVEPWVHRRLGGNNAARE